MFEAPKISDVFTVSMVVLFLVIAFNVILSVSPSFSQESLQVEASDTGMSIDIGENDTVAPPRNGWNLASGRCGRNSFTC